MKNTLEYYKVHKHFNSPKENIRPWTRCSVMVSSRNFEEQNHPREFQSRSEHKMARKYKHRSIIFDNDKSPIR